MIKKPFSMLAFAVLAAFAALATRPAFASEPRQCKQQFVAHTVFELCLHPGGTFQHGTYTLKADNVLIFSLVDDFAESVQLEHKVPDGPALEFALSRQGGNPIRITGGCTREINDGGDEWRLCNFRWGQVQVVRNIRFEFR